MRAKVKKCDFGDGGDWVERIGGVISWSWRV